MFRYLHWTRLPVPESLRLPVWVAMVIAVTLGLSTATWRWIEEPARRLPRLAMRASLSASPA
jgi:HAMP domain-containing protein